MPPAHQPSGLTASELQLAAAALRATCPAVVVDVAALRGGDDLVLWLRTATEPDRKMALHIVPGGSRGRVTFTRRRFVKLDFATGPHFDALRTQLVGGTLTDVSALSGERIARLDLTLAAGARAALVAELFGNRGLWFVLDAEGRVSAQSRLPQGKGRELRPGAVWQAPAARPVTGTETEAAVRFVPPVLDAIDAHFTHSDQHTEAVDLREQCTQALTRARKVVEHKLAGLQQQLTQVDTAPALRARADLMLAYAHSVRRGADHMRVPDPERDGEHLDLPLAPDKPVVAQAQALYERARRLEDAVAVTQSRLQETEQQRAKLDGLAQQLAEASDFAALLLLRDALAERKLVKASPAVTARKKAKVPPQQAYRRFVSLEGYEILCGKTNEQNDRLSLRTARGNDVWLHIGRGYAGSHVVIRVPKGKTASLDTLLDAATIAVHFSKARGAEKSEVIYTQAKYVRKPKGAPAGAVVPHQTKTLLVRLEEERLRRLLATSQGEP